MDIRANNELGRTILARYIAEKRFDGEKLE